LRAFAENCKQRRDRTALIDLMHGLNQHMTYTPGATEVDTSAAEAFAGRRVCQDHTHAFLACARSLGIPSRYVSGYLYSDSEHLASHAWAEAWLDDAWYSFDVTNELARPERHLKLAVGLDYLDACPVRGMRRRGCEQMHAKVLCRRRRAGDLRAAAVMQYRYRWQPARTGYRDSESAVTCKLASEAA
jgi:transglutaminase-like putative cysteine protease